MRKAWIGLLSIGLFWVGACASIAPEPLPSQEDVGSVHLAVLTSAPWFDYTDALQPYFELSADDALSQVLRIGQIRTRDEFDSLSVNVGIGRDDGQAGGASPEVESVRDRRERGIRPQAVAGNDAWERDAMTAYANATALYQEVQLLNRYVRDAVIPKGYVPFVVRLQVTLLPRRRDAPYDAYSTISFFSNGDGIITPASNRGDEGESKEGTAPEYGIRVLPILVTDNHEAALASSNRERIRQLGLAAGGAAGNVGAGIGVDRTTGELDRLAGTDLNSLLAVARLSDNTLLVRLGAMQQGSTRFAMVPRTHNVTLVVLVPEGSPSGLNVVARTEFRHVETGESLSPRSAERVDAMLLAAGEPHGIQDAVLLGELLQAAQLNRYKTFREKAGDGVRNPEELWIDLLSVRRGGQYSAVGIDLQSRNEPEAVLPGQTQPIVIDDDGRTCRVVLRGGRHIRPEALSAALIVKGPDGAVSLESTHVSVVPGVGIIIELPSPQLQGIAVSEKRGAWLRLRHRDMVHEFRRARYLVPRRGGVRPAGKQAGNASGVGKK